jgi:hypothetical protein
MPKYEIKISVDGDISETEKKRLIRVMTKALRADTRERNARLKKKVKK